MSHSGLASYTGTIRVHNITIYIATYKLLNANIAVYVLNDMAHEQLVGVVTE